MRIAGVQAAPAYMDRKATLGIVRDAMHEAAAGGADFQ